MEDPKRNQNIGQNQSDNNQERSGLNNEGRAGGVASTEDMDNTSDLNQSEEDMNTEE